MVRLMNETNIDMMTEPEFIRRRNAIANIKQLIEKQIQNRLRKRNWFTSCVKSLAKDKQFEPLIYLPRSKKSLTCPNCQTAVITERIYKVYFYTHVNAILLAPLLLSWMPYSMKRFKMIIHKCPICGIHLGISKIRTLDKKCMPGYTKS